MRIEKYLKRLTTKVRGLKTGEIPRCQKYSVFGNRKVWDCDCVGNGSALHLRKKASSIYISIVSNSLIRFRSDRITVHWVQYCNPIRLQNDFSNPIRNGYFCSESDSDRICTSLVQTIDRATGRAKHETKKQKKWAILHVGFSHLR